MADFTPPASFPTSHVTIVSQAASSYLFPIDISPSSLDTLPILTAILTRLQTNSPTSSLAQIGSPHRSQSQTQSLTQASTSSPSFQVPPTSAKDPHATFTTPLTTKDIPAATDSLKHGLQKTRLLVSQLPDIDRGIAEQEEEIRELEEKIAEQRKVLEKLTAMGQGEWNEGDVPWLGLIYA